MKKFLLSSLILASIGTTVFAYADSAKEITSGGGSYDELSSQIQTRGVKKVGGGDWFYKSEYGVTKSVYSHRSKKHSATVTLTSSKGTVSSHKAVRAAGVTATAQRKYVSGKNSVYWDNAPKHSAGDYYGGGGDF